MLLPFMILFALFPVPSLALLSSPDPSYSNSSHGAVVSEVKECSDAGADLMKQGGNAADAIIAATLCVCVVSAFHCGVGGGGFMIVRFNAGNGSHAYEMIDFRETMPSAGNKTMYSNSTDPTASTVGGLSVGVPGELRGWELLHERHAALPWSTLFLPAIHVARNGFIVNADLAGALDPATYPFLVSDPLWSEVYAPNGTILQEGDMCYRKRLADTFEVVAKDGADSFYSGKIAENMARAAAERGGILTTNDLSNYSALVRTPSNITYRNSTRLFSTVAPSSGSIVLSILKIFEGFPGNASEDDPAINLTTHRLIQATRFGYGQRTQFGDPAFTSNVSDVEQFFLESDTAAKVRSFITDTTTYPATFYDPSNYTILSDHGTAHVASMDSAGMTVSLTTTVNLVWGSQVMTEDGIILNDEMDDFSSPGQTNSFGFAASPINFIAPGKRPLSSIASTIVEDLKTGAVVMAAGAAGGSVIITATLQNLHYHLDMGMNANDTVHHGRWHDQLSNTTLFEDMRPEVGIPGFSNATVAFLQSLGYNTSHFLTFNSAGHVIIRKPDGSIDAASDPREVAGGAAVI